MTTLYFEASDEDDRSKTSLTKNGKHQNPQIFIGLLVGLCGYAIWYDIFEEILKKVTLIPFLEKMVHRFKLVKLVLIADSGLLSNDNIVAFEANGYEYILGARLKNESGRLKTEILQH